MMHIHPLVVVSCALTLVGCWRQPEIDVTVVEPTEESIEEFRRELAAQSHLDMPEERLEFESVGSGDKVGRWRAWIVQGEERRLLTEGVVEDGEIKTLFPTTVGRGCLLPPQSAYLQTWHWGESTIVWSVYVDWDSTNSVDVLAPGEDFTKRMSLKSLASAAAGLERKMREKGYPAKKAFAVLYYEGVDVKVAEDVLRGLWQIDHRIAVFPKFWRPREAKWEPNRSFQ